MLNDVRSRLKAALESGAKADPGLLRDAIAEIETLQTEVRFTYEAWLEFVRSVEASAKAHPNVGVVARVANISIESPKRKIE